MSALLTVEHVSVRYETRRRYTLAAFQCSAGTFHPNRTMLGQSHRHQLHLNLYSNESEDYLTGDLPAVGPDTLLDDEILVLQAGWIIDSSDTVNQSNPGRSLYTNTLIEAASW
ncbi:hypothetical protein [Exiguobacterium sp. s193]|uniref:hypothetical protein n=1 Tax=Exiguobacterium sp. s193 TaxID=2751207 RepID=UPI001BE86E0C|nr:hypothetical protein [Exiguobacterium sp. s193]